MREAESNIAILERLDRVLLDFGPQQAAELLSAADPVSAAVGLVDADVIASVDPDVEIDLEQWGQTWPGSFHYRGFDGFASFWREWLEAWGEFEFTRPRIEADGDWVVTEVLLDARGRASGAQVHWQFVQLWRFHEGRVFHLSTYASWDEAMAAARKSTPA